MANFDYMQLIARYSLLIAIVYLVCSFVAMSLAPYNWHVVVRIAAVLLIALGAYGIEKGGTK